MLARDKTWVKHNEIQLTKNKMYLNNQKMKNYPPSSKRARIEFHPEVDPFFGYGIQWFPILGILIPSVHYFI